MKLLVRENILGHSTTLFMMKYILVIIKQDVFMLRVRTEHLTDPFS